MSYTKLFVTPFLFFVSQMLFADTNFLFENEIPQSDRQQINFAVIDIDESENIFFNEKARGTKRNFKQTNKQTDRACSRMHTLIDI